MAKKPRKQKIITTPTGRKLTERENARLKIRGDQVSGRQDKKGKKRK